MKEELMNFLQKLQETICVWRGHNGASVTVTFAEHGIERGEIVTRFFERKVCRRCHSILSEKPVAMPPPKAMSTESRC